MARKWREVKQERADSDEWERVQRRVQRMGVNEMLDWVDVAGAGMFKGFRDYAKHESLESLIEIRTALLGVQAIVEDLIERHEAQR